MELETLIEDTTFVNWANGTNEEDLTFWDNYLLEHPEQKQKLMTARAMVIKKRLTLPEVADDQVKDDWSMLKSKLNTQKKKPIKIYLITSAVAASLLLISWFTFFNNDDIENTAIWSEVVTSNGEIREIILSDGTEVTLNANSILSYNNQRITKLEGEAYFDVTKNTDQPFQVQMKDSEITVLGTSFNVKSRLSGSSIALDEGKVRLKNLSSSEEVNLIAGEYATIDRKKIIISKQDLSALSSWKKNIWIFDRTSISKVIARMEETYGIQVNVKNPDILTKKISGKLSSKSPELIYNALEGMLGIKITAEGKQITLENRKE